MTLAKKRKKEMKDKGEKSIETEREHAKIEVFDQKVEKQFESPKTAQE